MEKAAGIYIKLKMFKEALKLMNNIKSPPLLIALAKAKESEGSFKEAETGYEKAQDFENVVRINLRFLDNPEKAKAVIRGGKGTNQSISMLADYCNEKGNHKEAIEFMLLADRREEAYVMAQSHNEMETYANIIISKNCDSEEFFDEYVKIAQYFEGKNL